MRWANNLCCLSYLLPREKHLESLLWGWVNPNVKCRYTNYTPLGLETELCTGKSVSYPLRHWGKRTDSCSFRRHHSRCLLMGTVTTMEKHACFTYKEATGSVLHDEISSQIQNGCSDHNGKHACLTFKEATSTVLVDEISSQKPNGYCDHNGKHACFTSKEASGTVLHDEISGQKFLICSDQMINICNPHVLLRTHVH